MTFEEAVVKASRAPNGCNWQEHAFCFNSIVSAPEVEGGQVLEVGSWLGGMSTTMACACQGRGFRLTCLDAWHLGVVGYQHDGLERNGMSSSPSDETKMLERRRHDAVRRHPLEIGCDDTWLFQQFNDQLIREGLRKDVRVINDDSLKACREVIIPNLVYVWIDSSHDRVHPYEEFKGFSGSVVPGGVVGFHDAQEAELVIAFARMEGEGLFEGWEEITPHELSRDGLSGFVRGPAYTDGIENKCGWRTRAWRRNG